MLHDVDSFRWPAPVQDIREIQYPTKNNLLSNKAAMEDKVRELSLSSSLRQTLGKSVPCAVCRMHIICMVITYSRDWINRVRLPNLLVVS